MQLEDGRGGAASRMSISDAKKKEEEESKTASKKSFLYSAPQVSIHNHKEAIKTEAEERRREVGRKKEKIVARKLSLIEL